MVPFFLKKCVGDFFSNFRSAKKNTSQKLHRKGAPLLTVSAWGCCLAIPRPTFSGSGPVFFDFRSSAFRFLGGCFFIFGGAVFWTLRQGCAGHPQKLRFFHHGHFSEIFLAFFFLVRCVLVFGPTFFFLLVGRFFDLGSAGIRMWAPGMFPYGEVSVK